MDLEPLNPLLASFARARAAPPFGESMCPLAVGPVPGIRLWTHNVIDDALSIALLGPDGRRSMVSRIPVVARKTLLPVQYSMRSMTTLATPEPASFSTTPVIVKVAALEGMVTDASARGSATLFSGQRATSATNRPYCWPREVAGSSVLRNQSNATSVALPGL